jgi:glycosyltransferase involved in cell wall biosynthesis
VRILIYSHAFAPKVGGVETIVLGVASGLARRSGASGSAGPDVTLATPTPRGTFDDSALPFRVVRQPGLLRLLRLIRAADVVHLAGPALGPLAAALLLRKPIVVEHHGFQVICPNGQLLHEPTQSKCPGHFMAGRHRQCIRCNAKAGLPQSLKLWMLTFPRRWLCTRVRSNITPTRWLSALLDLPRVTTIHHGLAAESGGDLPAISSPPVVAFIGRLVGTKGVDVLLRAAARVKSNGLGFRLRIIGDGPERPRLEAQAQALELTDRVKFLGYQPDANLREALAGASIIVVPSLTGEVFGLVALEGMLRGMVPIVSAGGALAEVVGDAGLAFPPGDSDALADCLLRAIAGGSADALRERSRRRAQVVFNEEEMVAQHFVLYRAAAPERAVESIPAVAGQ